MNARKGQDIKNNHCQWKGVFMFTIFARTILLYLIIIIGVRLMGKRQVGELEPSELVLSLLIADLAAIPMQDSGIPLHAGIIPILTLLSLTMIMSVLTMKSVWFRKLLCGKPSIVIRNGEMDQSEMRRNRLTIDELTEEMRVLGHTDISAVKYGILETNGKLTILPFAKHLPVTAQQMNASIEEQTLPMVIIGDGVLLKHNMKKCNLNDTWVKAQLKIHGCRSINEVFLLTVDDTDRVFFAKKEI